jgi:pyruvate/2-oxoglutarate dehydrogenase complex dihydrolipoamide acyltransferase (E2) component
MALVEVKVPDIGDFKDVAVIELLVKPGDTVAAEQSLLTVESDKASMEIPSSHAGVVKELQGQARRQGQPGQLVRCWRRHAAPPPVAGPRAGTRRGARRCAGTPHRPPRPRRRRQRPRSRSSCPTSATSTRSR